MRIYSDIHQAYLGSLVDVYRTPDYRTSPRGLPIREKVDYSFKVCFPTADPIQTHDLERNKTIAEYTAKEVELYNSGSNRVEDFAKASKFWEKIANPDGTINSAYGFLIWRNLSCYSEFENMMRTPWQWAKESLQLDKDTRQAVMHFALPEHKWMGNKDQVCTLTGNWLIRENELHFTVVMRSNDLVKGLTYDLPWFCSLMDKMLEELRPTYPNLKKGSYTHIAHSMHMYDRDEEVVKKMIGDM